MLSLAFAGGAGQIEKTAGRTAPDTPNQGSACSSGAAQQACGPDAHRVNHNEKFSSEPQLIRSILRSAAETPLNLCSVGRLRTPGGAARRPPYTRAVPLSKNGAALVGWRLKAVPVD